MKKNYLKGLFFAATFTGAAFLLSSAGVQAYTHDRVPLRDATGAVIAGVPSASGTCENDGTIVCNTGDSQTALDAACGVASAVCTPDSYSVPGAAAAYSAKETCGACHAYDAIERHSFHAQLGANEYKGWNAWAYGNWNSVASKGKPWVQSTGHAGKW